MEEVTLKFKVEKEVTLNLPTTAEEWELYSSKKGAANAARGMTAALKKAIQAPTKDKAREIMRGAMNKFAEFGASDTEPRMCAERYLGKGRQENWEWEL